MVEVYNIFFFLRVGNRWLQIGTGECTDGVGVGGELINHPQTGWSEETQIQILRYRGS